MDELERRLASLEVALVEVLAWKDPQALADARQGLIDGIPAYAGDKRAVRLGAAFLIEAAQKRFAPIGPNDALVAAALSKRVRR
jgi:hypothetical protein